MRRIGIAIAALLALFPMRGKAQYEQQPGHSIGTVTTRGKLIVLNLNEDALGKVNMFNLAHRTLRFTPGASGYSVQNLPLQWDADFGPALSSPQVSLKNFEFPFSGKTWNSFSVGVTGSITFGEPASGAERGGGRGRAGANRGGGLSVERFALLQEAAPQLVNTVPAISVFFKPRMSGTRYVKELDDRAVVTWSLTEPAGGIQDWTWTPTVNRFQAILRKDGTIELSYDDVAARDAIVGIYPMVTSGVEKEIETIPTKENGAAAPNLDIKNIKLSSVDGLYLKVSLEASGAIPPGNDPGIAGVAYRVCLDKKMPRSGCSSDGHGDIVWTIQGFGPPQPRTMEQWSSLRPLWRWRLAAGQS